MIAIIDYQSGNVASVKHALEKLGQEFVVTSDLNAVLSADKVIFPGQGRAGQAMNELKTLGLAEALKQVKTPFLGICLGMQLLYEYSQEDEIEGLGLIGGKVQKFNSSKDLKVPLIGWCTVTQTKYGQWFEEIPDTMYAYFVNSYYAPTGGEEVEAYYTYGDTRAAAMVKKDNFYGTQFHPEKSGPVGLKLLENFCELGKEKEKKTLIIPAIDLMDGRCVRLRQGRFEEKTEYAQDPVTVAQSFVEDGAQYIHVIDLDGAKAGEPKNTATVLSVIDKVPVPVQTGGGMRSEEAVKKYLDAGAARVILGTSALQNQEMVRRLVGEYGPGRVVVSVDGKDGMVAIKGWQETCELSVFDFIPQLLKLGATTMIYTDVKRDGTLEGPNVGVIEKILKFPIKVIIAGGVTTIEQARELRDRGAYGVIVGKALYEGKFNVQKALEEIVQPNVFLSLPKPANKPTNRIIACMDIAEGRVKKGTNFTELRDAGDPVELGRLYSEQGVDELMFLDITATVENRATVYRLVERVARAVNIPFSVGGGIKTIEDIRQLLQRGADKVSIGSAAVKNPSLVKEASSNFGSQCIVISVDPKWNGRIWEIYIKGGRVATGIDAIDFATHMEALGAGELLVNSIDRDGTKAGYDLELLKAIANAVAIPVIASSGAGKPEHFVEAFQVGADAALAANLFHFQELSISILKQNLSTQGMLVRL